MSLYELYKLNAMELKPEWLDAYGHLNEAYYLVPFSETTWLLQDQFGIGVDYYNETGGAIYTVETHMRYLKEVRAPATLEIESMVLGSDTKRIWFAHQMVVDGTVRATAEFMALHFDSKAGKTSPFPDDVQDKLKAAVVTDRPEWVSRAIGLG